MNAVAPDVTAQRTDIRQRLGEELKISCQCHSSPPGDKLVPASWLNLNKICLKHPFFLSLSLSIYECLIGLAYWSRGRERLAIGLSIKFQFAYAFYIIHQLHVVDDSDVFTSLSRCQQSDELQHSNQSDHHRNFSQIRWDAPTRPGYLYLFNNNC